MSKYTVFNGADRICEAEKYLNGKRIGMMTTASGVDKNAHPTYDIIAEKHTLTALFAPEHGIRSNLQDGSWGESSRDPETGAELFNINGGGCANIERALSRFDTLVYDVQDVGARFYTYLYNLAYLMKECATARKPVVVLDRIDPINAATRQGSWLDEAKCASSIGRYDIPTRYGLTVGEFAGYINTEKNIGCELYVIPCQGYKRDIYADETDLLFVNPSPNIPSVGTAINYIGTCIFEATNVSEGRGTTRPFDLVGAPFADSMKICREMNELRLPGVVFRRAFFTPGFNKWAGEVCEGVELHITDRNAYDPFTAALHLYARFAQYKEFTVKAQSLALRVGTDTFSLGIDDEMIRKYSDKCQKHCNDFTKKVSSYLLY